MKAMVASMPVVEPDPLAALEYADYYRAWASAARSLEKMGEELR